MIVCVCNGLSDRRIRAAAASYAGDSIGGLYRALGCRVQCGKCVPFVADIVREVQPERPLKPEPEADDATDAAPAAA
ncbi:MAG: (2Fe-2S)-binding protein [Geminicoccaceae bacterium]